MRRDEGKRLLSYHGGVSEGAMCNATLSDQSALFQSIIVAQRSCKLMVLIKQTTRPFRPFPTPIVILFSHTPQVVQLNVSFPWPSSVSLSFRPLLQPCFNNRGRAIGNLIAYMKIIAKLTFIPRSFHSLFFLSIPHFFMLHTNQHHALVFRFIVANYPFSHVSNAKRLIILHSQLILFSSRLLQSNGGAKAARFKHREQIKISFYLVATFSIHYDLPASERRSCLCNLSWISVCCTWRLTFPCTAGTNRFLPKKPI